MSDLSDPTARDRAELERRIGVVVDDLDNRWDAPHHAAAVRELSAELDGLRAQIEEARTMPHDINCAWLGDPDENPCDCYLSLLAQSPRGTVARIQAEKRTKHEQAVHRHSDRR